MAARRLLRIHAPAKINLSLRVLGTAADGYHQLRTVFQAIDLHDTLIFEERPGPFSLACDDPACPADEANLVWRAAETIARAAGGAGPPRDILIRIAKRIPTQAGLGGGSSDAAAALRGFAALWRVRIPRDKMRAMAATLGADVPFFLEGGTALGLERGDLLFPLVDRPAEWVTLVIPSFGVSTKEAYAWFDEDAPANPAPRVATRVADPRAPLVLPETVNDLQAPVVRHHPELQRIIARLVRAGASHAAMSGSGSAIFGLFATRASAARAANGLGARRTRGLVTQFVNRLKYQALAGPKPIV